MKQEWENSIEYKKFSVSLKRRQQSKENMIVSQLFLNKLLESKL